MSFSNITLIIEYLFGGMELILVPLFFPSILAYLRNTEFSAVGILAFAYLFGNIANNLITPVTRGISHYLAFLSSNKLRNSGLTEKDNRLIYNAILFSKFEGLEKRILAFESSRRFIRISVFNSLLFPILLFILNKIFKVPMLGDWFTILTTNIVISVFLLYVFVMVDRSYRLFILEIYDILQQAGIVKSKSEVSSVRVINLKKLRTLD